MVAKNDITGDPIISKSSTRAFREGWDRIFNAKEYKVLIELDDNDPEFVLIKMPKKQFDELVIEILKKVTAEQIASAMEDEE